MILFAHAQIKISCMIGLYVYKFTLRLQQLKQYIIYSFGTAAAKMCLESALSAYVEYRMTDLENWIEQRLAILYTSKVF